jgi:type IV secretory pathway VirB2 component (pilin)
MNHFRDLILSPAEAARLQERCAAPIRALARLLPVIAVGLLVTIFQDSAWGGTSAVFDDLATETEGAVFGPLGQSVVFVGALAGGIIALLKGAWLFAAMGIAIAGLMYGSQVVAGASTFSALLPGITG